MHPRFDPAAVAAEREATLVSLVPAMLTRLLDEGAGISRLRAVLLGGGRIPPGLPARAAAAGVRVVATYGATETCGGIVYDGLPLPGADLSISGDGEVLLRGPMLMRGYRGRPDLTEHALAEGWFHTGDAGEIGDDGRLRVHGRRDGMISTGGEKVAPEEVEAILAEHPQVREAAVCGLPDERWGQRVVALVVPAGPEPPSLEELRGHVAARAAAYKAPRELVLVPDLPRTASGKLRRPALERLALEGTRG
jgi:O-succinylbenzoic acid--CoA ligase